MNEPGKRKKIDEPAMEAESSASEHLSLSPELRAIEAEWARLRPREDRASRDRLMYLAGQASVAAPSRPARFPEWFWPASCVGMTAAATLLFAMSFLRPEPRVVERLVYTAPDSATHERNAQSMAGRGAAFSTARALRESTARGTWTAGMAFRLEDDLLALAPAAGSAATTPVADAKGDQPILSRRSLRALLNSEDAGISGRRRTNNVPPAGVKS